jgi:phosphoadenosine phosphosulfate reductase
MTLETTSLPPPVSPAVTGKDQLPELIEQTRGLGPEELLAFVFRRFGARVALASALGPESQIIVQMMSRMNLHADADKSQPTPARIFTIDTGRLSQETYDLIDATRKQYGLAIEVLFPDRADLEGLLRDHGVNMFYQGIEQRKACCRARKVLPLRRKLSQLDAWITGLRREQSVTRRAVETVEWDENHGLFKINPLADWPATRVWEYVHAYGVPYNALHGRGYPSIGCVPCTRPVAPGQGIRDGRWWWETPEKKECGLHGDGV